ncbi:MAG: B12-binding domain-containing radical SAM protein, partial [Candidatus Helarchaeota archaeon]|nr:B12-binding domain-containing radical SAM protein [Candidatus Helarchaeota archaeon]
TIENAMPNPPIGLGYLAGTLRAHGHQVDILDCAIMKDSYIQILPRIKSLNPDIIGITALSSYYNEMRLLARVLHKLQIPLILGGVHVSALPELSLRECRADFAIVGEGELTTLELMDKWQDKSARKQIKGIAYLENNQFKLNPRRELIPNLDELPFPAWELINPLKYPPIPHGSTMKRFPAAPILTTRGCPYSCAYCASTQFWGHQFRRRSARNIVDEIEYLVNTFKVREIHIWDDNFTLLKKHVVEFCHEILRRKLDLTFACPNGVRIDSLNKEILTLMKRTGFYSLTFAIESGSQKILDQANKKIELKIIPKVTKIAKNLGYQIPAYLMVGFPNETYKTARQTIQFAKTLPIDRTVFFLVQALPGSQLFEDLNRGNTINSINNTFHFFTYKNQIELTDGKNKIVLPRDAFREFYLRPIQLYRMVKTNLKTLQLRQLVIRAIMFLRTILSMQSLFQ